MYTDYQEEINQDDGYSSGNGQNNEKIKKIIFYVLVFVVALILIIFLFKGCSRSQNSGVGSGGVESGSQTPTIAINRQNVTLEVGEEIQLYADVLMSDKTNPVVSWHSEDSSVASVNDEGFVSANSKGTTSIIATYEENGKTYENKCIITVTSTVYEVEKINIQQDSISLKKGNSVMLQVETEPVGAKVDGLVYTSDNPGIATVNSKGLVSAVKAGVTTITVKTSDSKLSDSVTVTVTESGNLVVNPVSLQLVASSSTLKVGEKTTITAVITPSNATNKTLTWVSTNPSVLAVENGVVVAKRAGTATIVASTNNNISSQIKITVLENTVPVQGITILGDTNIEMTTGQTKKISYSITPSNATNVNIIYQSNNTNVATVDSNGVISAVGSGNAVITVKTSDGSVYAYINVSVKGTSSSEGGSGTDSGSSSDSTGNSSSTCSVSSYNMVTVSSGGDGVIYTELKDNMKVATSDVSVKITNISSCIEKMEYAVNCSSQGCNYSTGKVGTSFKVSKNGTNTIVMRGTTKDGKKLTKYYYVKINKSTPPSFSVTNSYTTDKATFTPKLTNVGSGSAYIYFCVSRLTDECSISFINSNVFQSGTTRSWDRSKFDHICFQAKDSSGNYSSKKCYGIKSSAIIKE